MARTPLYSAARGRGHGAGDAGTPAAPAAVAGPTAPSTPTNAPAATAGASGHRAAPALWTRRAALAAGGLGAGAAGALFTLWLGHAAAPKLPTQEDIDRAVLHTLSTKELPSSSARAAATVAPSVVRVSAIGEPPSRGRAAATPDKAQPKSKAAPKPNSGSGRPGRFGLPDDRQDEGDDERGVGTGVVITDRGVILTNLHVVTGARRLKVTFADGTEADASVINVQPDNDLAVLQAHKLPDDLQPATMRSTGDLKPGDHVTAVGFPFGIGPSVSSGVVSGLKREFLSPEGKRVLSNLIQFDAAANPGNSGGPLVTDDGAVVGIVTAILNPKQERFFVGIGFAVPIENAAAGAGMPPF